MILGVRRIGETPVRFASWQGSTAPEPGSQVRLDDGSVAMVVISAAQFLTPSPQPTLRIIELLNAASDELARGIQSEEAERFDIRVRDFPALGSRLATASGSGTVIARDLRHRTVTVRLKQSGDTEIVPLEAEG